MSKRRKELQESRDDIPNESKECKEQPGLKASATPTTGTLRDSGWGVFICPRPADTKPMSFDAKAWTMGTGFTETTDKVVKPTPKRVTPQQIPSPEYIDWDAEDYSISFSFHEDSSCTSTEEQ